MPKDCQMKDCEWYNALNYPHDAPDFDRRRWCIPPEACETCCRFHDDNYSPKKLETKALE